MHLLASFYAISDYEGGNQEMTTITYVMSDQLSAAEFGLKVYYQKIYLKQYVYVISYSHHLIAMKFQACRDTKVFSCFYLPVCQCFVSHPLHG